MTDRLANARPLGFAALAMGFWMFGMVNAGWFPDAATAGPTASWLMSFGAVALLLAAAVEFLRGHTWHALYFAMFAGFTWGYSAAAGEPSAAYNGWWLLLWAVFLFYGWLAAGGYGVEGPVKLFALGAFLAFLTAGVHGLTGITVLEMVSGYLDLATGGLAFYASWLALNVSEPEAPEPATGAAAGSSSPKEASASGF